MSGVSSFSTHYNYWGFKTIKYAFANARNIQQRSESESGWVKCSHGLLYSMMTLLSNHRTTLFRMILTLKIKIKICLLMININWTKELITFFSQWLVDVELLYFLLAFSFVSTTMPTRKLRINQFLKIGVIFANISPYHIWALIDEHGIKRIRLSNVLAYLNFLCTTNGPSLLYLSWKNFGKSYS